MRRGRHRRVWAATALGLAFACTGSSGAGLNPSPTETEVRGLVSGACRVTRSADPDQVPQRVLHEGGVSSNWYGNDVLWVLLPNGGRIVKAPGEKLAEKFPWVRLVHGTLRIDGRRLDGAAPPARAQVPSGYGLSGFQASAIVFPKVGCWVITGTIADEKLTFVVEVRRG